MVNVDQNSVRANGCDIDTHKEKETVDDALDIDAGQQQEATLDDTTINTDDTGIGSSEPLQEAETGPSHEDLEENPSESAENPELTVTSPDSNRAEPIQEDGEAAADQPVDCPECDDKELKNGHAGAGKQSDEKTDAKDDDQKCVEESNTTEADESEKLDSTQSEHGSEDQTQSAGPDAPEGDEDEKEAGKCSESKTLCEDAQDSASNGDKVTEEDAAGDENGNEENGHSDDAKSPLKEKGEVGNGVAPFTDGGEPAEEEDDNGNLAADDEPSKDTSAAICDKNEASKCHLEGLHDDENDGKNEEAKNKEDLTLPTSVSFTKSETSVTSPTKSSTTEEAVTPSVEDKSKSSEAVLDPCTLAQGFEELSQKGVKLIGGQAKDSSLDLRTPESPASQKEFIAEEVGETKKTEGLLKDLSEDKTEAPDEDFEIVELESKVEMTQVTEHVSYESSKVLEEMTKTSVTSTITTEKFTEKQVDEFTVISSQSEEVVSSSVKSESKEETEAIALKTEEVAEEPKKGKVAEKAGGAMQAVSSFFGFGSSKKDEEKTKETKVEEEIAKWGKPLGLPSPIHPGGSARSLNNDTNKSKVSGGSSRKPEKKVTPLYMDLAYVPHHGDANYTDIEFFKRVRARYYVFSGVEPSRAVFDALLEAKKTWDNKELGESRSVQSI